jgi:multiple sugar transport system ATP-binding protein
MLRLSHTLARKPATLSGGEQQRCAIGRALIRRPRILLLDEPLTNLDAKLRHDTRAEFKRLHRELGTTMMIYATPDQLEALSMGRRIGVLRQGRVVQVGTPDAVYTAPGSDFVATLVGDPPINLVPATLRDNPGGRALDLPFTAIDAEPWREGLGAFPAGSEMLVGVRPQGFWPLGFRPPGFGIEASAVGSALARPRFTARVFLTEPLGDVTILDLRAGDGSRLKMVLPQERAYEIALDSAIECEIDTSQICLFAQGTGTAIDRHQGEAVN